MCYAKKRKEDCIFMGEVVIKTDFLENHLLKANHDYAMVYLCALKYISSNESIPSAEKWLKCWV